MQMHLQHISPPPLLKGYIEKIWVFKSNSRISDEDMKLMVPTGRIKLILPFQNVTNETNGLIHLTKKDCITLIGITDVPRIAKVEADNPTGTIGIEFNPEGAYRFFRLNHNDVKNQIHPLADILGKTARQLQEQISNTPSIENKIVIVQQFLISQFLHQTEDPIFDFCVQKIRLSKGRISIRQLEKETGYSSRWLNMKFLDKIGASPKNLSAIIRFQEFYRVLAHNPTNIFDQKLFYDYYYDQSHFIKDFRRFTGMPPSKLAKITNDFGNIFYK
jgi:AraC-like DNA-binding protein